LSQALKDNFEAGFLASPARLVLRFAQIAENRPESPVPFFHSIRGVMLATTHARCTQRKALAPVSDSLPLERASQQEFERFVVDQALFCGRDKDSGSSR
jgi:hypothetical protein